MAKSSSTKAAAKRKSSPKMTVTGGVAHVPTTLKTAASGNAFRPTQAKNAQLALPNGTPTVTPVTPPTFDPSLTPTDEANRSIELGQWDDYLANLDQQKGTQDADIKLNTGNIDQSLAQGLESNDWNSAARGLGDSSIKAQNRAQMTAQASAQKGAEETKGKVFGDYVAGQHKQVDTVYKPGIHQKYNELAARNAQAATDAWNAAHPAQDTGAQDSSGGDTGAPQPAPELLANGQPTGTAGAGGPAAPGQPPTISAAGSQAQQETPDGVVKNGKFYHVYGRGTANERWVYVRPAR